MEALTQLVADSLARYGLDRPVDPRRLQWSRWFRCDSPHSLLVVPSKPGIFALAEEIMDLGPRNTSGPSNALEASNASVPSKIHVGTAALGCPAEQSSAAASSTPTAEGSTGREGHDFSRAVKLARNSPASAAEVPVRRMLAVLQFSEDDDMAFTLDRMFTKINPMRARLSSGRCFLRFVVIEDQAQRRSICNALNQWMLNSAEKATGIGADFQSSLELATDRVGRTLPSTSSEPALSLSKGQALSDSAASMPNPAQVPQTILKSDSINPVAHLDSGANKNLHCPHPFPSGF